MKSLQERLDTAEQALRDVYLRLHQVKPGEPDRCVIYRIIGEAQGIARGTLMVNEAEVSELDAIWKETFDSVMKAVAAQKERAAV